MMRDIRGGVLLGVIATLLAGCSAADVRFPSRSSAPVPAGTVEVGERVGGQPLPTDGGGLALISLSPVVPGATATATFRYRAYQTCHAQVIFSDTTALPLGTYESGLGESPTWVWTVPPNAPRTGRFVVACGVDVFEVAFGTSVGATPIPLRPSPAPWPTPLSCATSRQGC